MWPLKKVSIIREIQVRISRNYYFRPVTLANIKKNLMMPSVGWDMRNAHVSGWKWVNHLWKQLLKLTDYILYNFEISFQGTLPWKYSGICLQREMYKDIHCSALYRYCYCPAWEEIYQLQTIRTINIWLQVFI